MNGGTHTVNGGDGIDTIDASGAASAVSIQLAPGSPYLNFENATGGGGNDTIYGSNENNILNGGGGNDTIVGLGGDDTINGGAGDDVMKGSLGNDTLTGGIGNDKFVFSLDAPSGNVAKNEDGSTDRVTDFTLGEDKIQFMGPGAISVNGVPQYQLSAVGTNGEANTLSALFSASDASGKISAKLIEGATDNQYTKLEIKINDGTDTNTITLEYSGGAQSFASASSSSGAITHDGDSTGNGSVQLGTFAQFLTALGGASQVEIG